MDVSLVEMFWIKVELSLIFALLSAASYYLWNGLSIPYYVVYLNSSYILYWFWREIKTQYKNSWFVRNVNEIIDGPHFPVFICSFIMYEPVFWLRPDIPYFVHNLLRLGLCLIINYLSEYIGF